MQDKVRESYDRVAHEYQRRIADELRGKPLDCQLLDELVGEAGRMGTICDLGCGPGHVARYLQERGASVVGVDLSPRMVETARKLNPGIEFSQGDMFSLKFEDEAWSAIVCFYSIVNIRATRLADAFREMKRALKRGGKLLLAFHVGEGSLHLDEWWSIPVLLDFFFFSPDEVAKALGSAGLLIEKIMHRDPYPEVEHPSRRAYILCRKTDPFAR